MKRESRIHNTQGRILKEQQEVLGQEQAPVEEKVRNLTDHQRARGEENGHPESASVIVVMKTTFLGIGIQDQIPHQGNPVLMVNQ